MKRLCSVLMLMCLIALPLFAQRERGWEILRADYGSGNRWVDVTERVRSLIQSDSLNFRVDTNTLGVDPRPGKNKSLRLQLQDHQGRSRQVTFRQNAQVRLSAFNRNQSRLQITRAVYGAGNRWLDVTPRLRSQVTGHQLHLRVNNDTMGDDAARNQNKTLRVDYTFDGRADQVVVKEGDTLRLNSSVGANQQERLYITRAVYGADSRWTDVTSRLNSQIQGNQLHLQVTNNTMGGDPAQNQSKTLRVDYTFDGRAQQAIVNEGDTLRLNSSIGTNHQSRLHVTRAVYGVGNRWTDVTSRLNSQIQGNQLHLQVTNSTMGGDPAQNQSKTLRVDYTFDGRAQQATANEGDTLRLNNSVGNYESGLQVLRAVYGSGNRSSDVTSRLNLQIRDERLSVQVNNVTMGGDPAPGQSKTLTVQYAMDGRTSQVVVHEGDTLRLPYNYSSHDVLHINRATYGSGYRTYDVTSRLNSQIQGDQLAVQVNHNSMGGDPAPGQDKTLTVQYTVNGRTEQVVVHEGDTLRLPYGTSGDLSPRIRCESLDAGYGRNYCPANTRNGVRLSRRLGDRECIEGSSWGYDGGGVWVSNGCRAEFELQRGWFTGAATTIPNGTELSVRTNEVIDSKTATVGQTFSAVVAADVLDSSGAVTIPKGSEAQLVIRSASDGGTISTSDLVLDVDSLTVLGRKYLVSTDDREEQGGQGVGANRRTAIMVGGGAAVGTVIGAIVGGAKGAAIGAALGAGGGLGAQVLTRGKEVRVPAETLLSFRLDQDLRLRAAR